MKLTVIQLLADDINRFQNTSHRIQQKIREACQEGADLILLPECAYPAYMIGLEKEPDSLSNIPDFLSRMSELAAGNQVYLAVGTAMFEDGVLYNGVAVFDRSGEMIAKAYKSNLWHFDGKWFSQGEPGCVFDTEFGKIGVMVCADGRIPEIARILRLKGAGLILDAVNLVASACTPDQLTNQQYQFMLQARAKENGVYIAVCDKAGIESSTVTCLGRSMIVTPDGDIAAECSPDKEEMLTYELELKEMPPLKGRRPELYRILAEPIRTLPVTAVIERPYRLSDLECFTAVIRIDCTDEADYVKKAVDGIRRAAILDSRLAVLPEMKEGMGFNAGSMEYLCSHTPDHICAVTAYGTDGGGKRAVVFNADGIKGELPASHIDGSGDADEIRVLELFPGCCVAAVFGEEMEIPEIARVAMLKGADILIWFDRKNTGDTMKMMQTRAAENKVFVLRTTPCGSMDYSLGVNPDGGKLFTTFCTLEQTASGMIHTSLSKSKEVVPGTNIVYGRNPNYYKELTI